MSKTLQETILDKGPLSSDDLIDYMDSLASSLEYVVLLGEGYLQMRPDGAVDLSEQAVEDIFSLTEYQKYIAATLRSKYCFNPQNAPDVKVILHSGMLIERGLLIEVPEMPGWYQLSDKLGRIAERFFYDYR